jgi:hypothetical protein
MTQGEVRLGIYVKVLKLEIGILPQNISNIDNPTSIASKNKKNENKIVYPQNELFSRKQTPKMENLAVESAQDEFHGHLCVSSMSAC